METSHNKIKLAADKTYTKQFKLCFIKKTCYQSSIRLDNKLTKRAKWCEVQNTFLFLKTTSQILMSLDIN